MASELALQPQLQFLLKNAAVTSSMDEKSRLFDRFATGWWENRDFPYLLSRTVQQSQQIDLSFLENEELRRIVLEDYQEARRSFQSKNFKATLLICGSIAEALLAAVIDKAGIAPTKKIYEAYKLVDLVDMAANNGFIRDSNLLSLLKPLREYRNMIHPGVQVRKALVPDAEKARISVDTISLLIKELKKTSRS